jgi:hypothetical protein
VAASLAGCGPDRAADRTAERAPFPLPVEVLGDTARAITLAVRPPEEGGTSGRPPSAGPEPRDPPGGTRVWIARVTPAPPGAGGPPLPEPASEVPDPPPAPPALDIDPGLDPPILRRAAPLVVPDAWRARLRGRPVSVELDVLVGEDGEVAEVEWAGGTRDSLLLDAAARCAAAMSFYPALQRGQPIAVWCRQRFDFADAARTR